MDSRTDTQIILDVCQVTTSISASSTTTTTTSSAAVGTAAGKPTMPAAYAGQRQHCCPISWTRTVTTLYTGVCIPNGNAVLRGCDQVCRGRVWARATWSSQSSR